MCLRHDLQSPQCQTMSNSNLRVSYLCVGVQRPAESMKEIRVWHKDKVRTRW